MNGRDPERIGDVLAKMTEGSKLGQHLEHAVIWSDWEHIIGKALVDQTRPIGIKDGQLRVEADNSVLMHKLSYRKWDMIGRINRLAKKELVHDIFFVLAEDE